MTLPTRHTNAPFRDGEGLAGADLEADIDSLFGIIGEVADTIGKMSDVNCRPNANFDGSKMLDSSFAAAKLQDLSVSGSKLGALQATTAKILDDSVGSLGLIQGAVLKTDFDNRISGLGLTGSYQTVASTGFTTGEAGSSVLLWFNGTFKATASLGTMNTRVRRNTTVLNIYFGFKFMTDDLGTDLTEAGFPLSLIWLDTGHAADTAEAWDFQASLVGGTMANARMLAMELRK